MTPEELGRHIGERVSFEDLLDVYDVPMYMYKTGAELKEYVKSSRVCGYKSRDFVQRVVDYCESDENYHKLKILF